MNQLRREVNNFGGCMLQVFYMLVSYKVNLSFKYDNSYEFFVGMIVTTVLMNILEFAIYRIAFDRAGRCYGDSSDKKIYHWFVRVGLILVVYLISLTPLCDVILTPIVKDCTQWSVKMMNWFTSNMNKNLSDIFSN